MLASVHTLFAALVDYAGLFPPAQLDLVQAMQHYQSDRTSSDQWMLAHFVLPITRWPEFESYGFASVLPDSVSSDLPDNPKPWSISLIIPKDHLDHPLDLIQTLNQIRERSTPNLQIAALEFPPLPLPEIDRILPHLPPDLESFFEIPWTSELTPYLTILGGSGALAKIRTGGLTANTFPSTTQLCDFLQACVAAQLPFKATAGLHHPLPGTYRLTYAPDSPTATMHGFLNLTVAAALLYWQKITPQQTIALLEDTVGNHFQFTATGIRWQTVELSVAEIRTARQCCFRSFGSCSFQEPIEGLVQLNVL